MNSTTALADLDELILLCRDEKARTYIVEAVACYRSGAYRSAIVATWTAVCYDTIDKLRELALSGNTAAARHVAEIAHTHSTNNLAQALKFERDILAFARDQYALISHLEYVDLSRLQEDRNRCAHPSLVSEDQPFNPSGELARLHIRSAVVHLLQHQPVQGKHALDRLLSDVHSEYFPTTVKKAIISLTFGPLKRPRDSLVRNFVVVLLKDVLTPSIDYKYRGRALAALGATKDLHPEVFEITLQENLPTLFKNTPDEALFFEILLLIRINDIWHFLPKDVCLRLEEFTTMLPVDNMLYLDEYSILHR